MSNDVRETGGKPQRGENGQIYGLPNGGHPVNQAPAPSGVPSEPSIFNRNQPKVTPSVSNNRGLLYNPLISTQFSSRMGMDPRVVNRSVASIMDQTGRFTNGDSRRAITVYHNNPKSITTSPWIETIPAIPKPAHRGFTNAQLIKAAVNKAGGSPTSGTGGATANQVADATFKNRKTMTDVVPKGGPTYTTRTYNAGSFMGLFGEKTHTTEPRSVTYPSSGAVGASSGTK